MFSVKFYTDNILRSTLEDLSFSLAYSRALPNKSSTKNRWNILLREQAFIEASTKLAGETIRIAWEDISDEFPTSHILIMKQESIMLENINAYNPPPRIQIKSQEDAHKKALDLHNELSNS